MKEAKSKAFWCAVVLVTTLGSVRLAHAEDRGVPIVTVTGGFGNSVGFLGIQGERYLGGGRASLFAGLGYSAYGGEVGQYRKGIAGALGVRAYTPGSKHRAFLEASVCEIGKESWYNMESGLPDQASRYGPALQIGYRLVSRGGFTSTLSAGVGYAVGAKSSDLAALAAVGNLTIGYTWRRR